MYLYLKCYQTPQQKRVLDNWIILKVWRTVTLQPFDLQECIKQLQIGLLPLLNIPYIQEHGSIFRVCFVVSKYSHFDSACAPRVCKILAQLYSSAQITFNLKFLFHEIEDCLLSFSCSYSVLSFFFVKSLVPPFCPKWLILCAFSVFVKKGCSSGVHQR